MATLGRALVWVDVSPDALSVTVSARAPEADVRTALDAVLPAADAVVKDVCQRVAKRELEFLERRQAAARIWRAWRGNRRKQRSSQAFDAKAERAEKRARDRLEGAQRQKRAENRLAFKPSMRKGDRTGPVPTEKAREATKSECRRALAESTGLDRSVTETSEAD
jgi:hypothetical protein